MLAPRARTVCQALPKVSLPVRRFVQIWGLLKYPYLKSRVQTHAWELLSISRPDERRVGPSWKCFSSAIQLLLPACLEF